MPNEVFWISQSKYERDKIPKNPFSDAKLWIPLQGLEEHKKGKYLHCGELVKHWGIIYCGVGDNKNDVRWVFFGEDKMIVDVWLPSKVEAYNDYEEVLKEIREEIDMLFTAREFTEQ